MQVYLSDGTLISDSCFETYRLSNWRLDGEELVVERGRGACGNDLRQSRHATAFRPRSCGANDDWRRSLRGIFVMTTVAMVAGMLPVAIGIHGDNSFRGPMAVAVIGGLITSTMLTLVIVPAVFTLVDDIERWLAPKVGKMLSVHTPEEGVAATEPARSATVPLGQGGRASSPGG